MPRSEVQVVDVLSKRPVRVDLGDEADPVMMLDKGEEIDQIDESLRTWNAGLDNEGRVVAGNAASDGGSEE